MVNLLKKALALGQTNNQEFGGEAHQPVSIEAFVTPTDQQFQVNYQGLLKNSGARDVYLHYGIDNWAHTSTVKMDHNLNGGFTALIQPKARAVEFCFKDAAENWDNNNGSNWRAQVSLE
jgi:hypothetical protein